MCKLISEPGIIRYMPQDKLATLAAKSYRGSDLPDKLDKSYTCK